MDRWRARYYVPYDGFNVSQYYARDARAREEDGFNDRVIWYAKGGVKRLCDVWRAPGGSLIMDTVGCLQPAKQGVYNRSIRIGYSQSPRIRRRTRVPMMTRRRPRKVRELGGKFVRVQQVCTGWWSVTNRRCVFDTRSVYRHVTVTGKARGRGRGLGRTLRLLGFLRPNETRDDTTMRFVAHRRR